jgi:hypothetical protein
MKMIEVPVAWIKGQLLDVKRYSDGSYKVFDLYDQSEKPPFIHFDNTSDCQNFISEWYAPCSR